MSQKQSSTIQLFTSPSSLVNKENRLKPFVKWPGGKTRELEVIECYLPSNIDNYYEPFVGGGALYFAMSDSISQFFINDKSDRLIDLYRFIKSKKSEFFVQLTQLNEDWKDIAIHFDLHWYTPMLKRYQQFKEDWAKILEEVEAQSSRVNIEMVEDVLTPKQRQADLKRQLRIDNKQLIDTFNLDFIRWKSDLVGFRKQLEKVIPAKMITLNNNERKNGSLSTPDLKSMLLTSVKQSFYDHMRTLLNDFDKADVETVDATKRACVYYFIRMFSYSSMFRYNRTGGFNVPYGGKSYNNNNFDEKLKLMQGELYHRRLGCTTIANGEYHDLLTKYRPTNNDFIFLDPPYDSEFSTYEKNIFAKSHQTDLADFLIENFPNNNTVSYPKWMMVIKNTDLIYNLYSSPKAKNAGIRIEAFDKNYAVSFMNRNDQSVKHLIIMNYVLQDSVMNLDNHKHTDVKVEKVLESPRKTSSSASIGQNLKPVHQAFNEKNIPQFYHEVKTEIYNFDYTRRIERVEEDYRNLICSYLRGAIHHDKVRSETPSNKGQSDIAIVDDSHVFVIELKVAPKNSTDATIDKLLAEGIQQIEDKNYGKKYGQGGRPVYMMCFVIQDRDLTKGGYWSCYWDRKKHQEVSTLIRYLPKAKLGEHI